MASARGGSRVVGVEALLRRPLDAVAAAFAAACPPGTAAPPAQDAEYDDANGQPGFAAALAAVLQDPRVAAAVPELNAVGVEAVAPGSVVRYRGLVQDMFNTEYYVGAYRAADGAWRTTKYTDGAPQAGPAAPASSDLSDCGLWERRVVYVVPVPGESAWCRDADRAAAPPAAPPTPADTPRAKRGRDDVASPTPLLDALEAGAPPQLKRAAAGAPCACGELRCARGVFCVPVGPEAQPDAFPSGRTAAGDVVAPYFPLQGERGTPVLVKLYDGADTKLNEVVEVFGVLGAPELNDTDMDGDFAEEEVALHPPTSQVPRLHAMVVRTSPPPVAQVPPPEALRAAAPELRRHVVGLLAGALGGDVIAAEYALMNLVSRVYSRQQPLALGKFSVNLVGVPSAPAGGPSDTGRALAAVLEAIMPRSALMPLSLEELNAASWVPQKDYGKNRLLAGRLQLGEGTHIVADETAMREGQLTETGVRNLSALKELIETQACHYDFQFYQMPINLDVQVLLLSAGKSLLPSDAAVPHRPTAEPAVPAVAEDNLGPLRAYIAAARALDYAIPPEVSKAVEDDLVAARQADPSLGQEVLHRWLTMARLMSVSYGEQSLSLERWRAVRELERRVEERARAC